MASRISEQIKTIVEKDLIAQFCQTLLRDIQDQIDIIEEDEVEILFQIISHNNSFELLEYLTGVSTFEEYIEDFMSSLDTPEEN